MRYKPFGQVLMKWVLEPHRHLLSSPVCTDDWQILSSGLSLCGHSQYEGQQLVSDTCGQPATQQADSSVLFFAKILLNPLTRSLPLRPPLDQCLIAQHQMDFT